ncbi:MAG: prolyl oligopeptidase family serine peptidase [Clostridiales bacterium]|nr:prolyl oligopeptidase family serine peptidase [Clostridiales bacterium]
MDVEYKNISMTPQNVHLFAYTNRADISGNIKAVFINFKGLNFTTVLTESDDFAKEMGALGILVITPYCGPWNWMNDKAIRYTDKVIENVCIREGLDEHKTRFVYGGASMGGQCALVYTRYAKIPPVACFAMCPVCDLKYHANERQDLPRTLYCAYEDGTDNWNDAIERHSPYHLIDELPDIPYFIIHGNADKSVNKEMHSDRFAEKMRKAGKRVDYTIVDGAGHGLFKDYPEYRKEIVDKLKKSCLD